METKKRGYNVDLCIRDMKEKEHLKKLAREKELSRQREKERLSTKEVDRKENNPANCF